MSKQTSARVIFGLYLCVMVYLLFLQQVRLHHIDSFAHYLELLRSGSFNLRPFETIGIFMENLVGDDPYWAHHAAINLAGNVVMFVPAGYLLPRVWAKADSLKLICLYVLCALIVVETMQHVTLTGVFDIDDIILNMAGAALGGALSLRSGKGEKNQ
ncbi:MAG: VanZ family protein [Clostridia bacterium]|nr:VanZ family protein [Clostridia bacterium]